MGRRRTSKTRPARARQARRSQVSQGCWQGVREKAAGGAADACRATGGARRRVVMAPAPTLHRHTPGHGAVQVLVRLEVFHRLPAGRSFDRQILP